MKTYKCNKQVKAFKISIIDKCENSGWFLHDKDGLKDVYVTDEWIDKHNPQIGGYFVEYEDGYASYSPAKAFEDVYQLLTYSEIAYGQGKMKTVIINADGRIGISIVSVDAHEIGHTKKQAGETIGISKVVVIWLDNIAGARVLQDQINMAIMKLQGFDTAGENE